MIPGWQFYAFFGFSIMASTAMQMLLLADARHRAGGGRFALPALRSFGAWVAAAFTALGAIYVPLPEWSEFVVVGFAALWGVITTVLAHVALSREYATTPQEADKAQEPR